MGFWSKLTGTTSQEEQDAQFAAKQAAFNAANQRRYDAGTESKAKFENNLDYIQNTKLDNTTTAAELGAFEGATELGYNPVQWWDDTQSGFSDVSSGVSGVVSKVTAGLKNFAPNFKYIAIILVIFLFIWAGGLNLISGTFKKK